jgi:hypothetical protein
MGRARDDTSSSLDRRSAEPRRHVVKRFLRALGGRKLFLALSPVIAAAAAVSSVATVHVLPPSIALKQIAYSTATTQFYIASRQALSNSGVSGDRYSAHAQALADVMTSPELRADIAEAAEVPATRLAIDGPVANNLQRTQQEPTAQKRSNQILTEGDPYRVTLDDDPATSVIAVTAQAPTADTAIALADGAGRGLAAYLIELERSSRINAADGIEVNQLAPAVATPPSLRGDVQVAAFTFGAVLFLWILLVRGVSRGVNDARTLRRQAARLGELMAPKPEPLPATSAGGVVDATGFATTAVAAARRGRLVASWLARDLHKRERERRESSPDRETFLK